MAVALNDKIQQGLHLYQQLSAKTILHEYLNLTVRVGHARIS